MNSVIKKIGKNVVTKYYEYTRQNRFMPSPDQDWEVLVIFDACRFDLFKKYNIFNGELKKVYSAGSCTGEWFRKTFVGKNYAKVTYISANPVISNYLVKKNYGENPFNKIIDLWKFGWSKKDSTVKPSIVNEVTENLIKQSKDKIIIHYLQPHYPFIGSVKLHDESMNLLQERVESEYIDENFTNISPWGQAKNGKIDLEELIEAYESNVEYVFEETRDFIESIDKKVYITSDHGNSYGTLGAYGHPCNFHIPELIEVPLLKMRK